VDGRIQPETGWTLLIYRVPSDPASKRVAIWRDVKRLGGLYLQQCVCILPRRPDVEKKLERITEKIPAMDGVFTLFDVPTLRPDDEDRIVAAFRDLREKEYAEIEEECSSKFMKEVEFEHFRENYTFEEAEEIGQDLEKIRRWFAQVQVRDWFAAPGRDRVTAWLDRCQLALSSFEETVYALHGSDDGDVPKLRTAAPAVSDESVIHVPNKSVRLGGQGEGKISS